MKMRIFLSLISIFLLFGCTTASLDTKSENLRKEEDISSKLSDTSWKLTEISGEKVNIPNTDSGKAFITINFTAEGIHGISVVNNYSSSYTVKENIISFGVIASTKMAGSPEMMDLEIKYFGILEKSEKFEMPDDNTLILKSGNEFLKFKKI